MQHAQFDIGDVVRSNFVQLFNFLDELHKKILIGDENQFFKFWLIVILGNRDRTELLFFTICCTMSTNMTWSRTEENY